VQILQAEQEEMALTQYSFSLKLRGLQLWCKSLVEARREVAVQEMYVKMMLRKALRAWTAHHLHRVNRFQANCLARRRRFDSLRHRACCGWYEYCRHKAHRIVFMQAVSQAVRCAWVQHLLKPCANAATAIKQNRLHKLLLSAQYYQGRCKASAFASWKHWVRLLLL
jgi:hypothetical protein